MGRSTNAPRAGALLAALLAAAGAQEPARLRFDPGPEPLRRELTLALDLELVEVRLDDRGWDGRGRTAEPGHGTKVELRLDLASRELHTEGRDGQPVLRRTYGELLLEAERDPPLFAATGWARARSFVAGRTVEFTWDPATGAAHARLAAGPSPPDLRPLLDSLQADLDFGWILADAPPPAPESGAPSGWDLDPARLVRALWPGGFTRPTPGRRPFFVTDNASLPDLPRFWWAGVGGTALATLGPEGDETADVARVLLALELEGRPAEALAEALEAAPWEQDDPELENLYGGGVSWSFEGTGLLEWSRGLHRMSSFSIEGEVVVRRDFEWERGYFWSAGELHCVWRGPLRFRTTVTAAEQGE